MVQIIEGNKKKSFGEAVLGGLAESAGPAIEKYFAAQGKKEATTKRNKKINDLTGMDTEGLDEKSAAKAFEFGLKNKADNEKEITTQAEMKKFGRTIKENYPEDAMKQLLGDIYESSMPSAEKNKIVQTMTKGIDPFRMEQENRRNLDLQLKHYNTQIRELSEDYKNANYKEKDKIKEEMGKIKRQRDKLFGSMLMNGMVSEEDQEENVEEEGEKKPKFDRTNKEHMAKFNQLRKTFKDDKKKVNEALAKEFSL